MAITAPSDNDQSKFNDGYQPDYQPNYQPDVDNQSDVNSERPRRQPISRHGKPVNVVEFTSDYQKDSLQRFRRYTLDVSQGDALSYN